eukprot:GHVL01018170.1.p2 GENE.GHVL01018170.1~~GHVL01018170.1.p2  ORF type:complete len:117 (-),score=20.31 GHVL01018170.1:227-577(-)
MKESLWVDLGDAIVPEVEVVDPGGHLEVVLADGPQFVEGQVELEEPGGVVEDACDGADAVVLQGEGLQVAHALKALAVDLDQLVVGEVQRHQLGQLGKGRLFHHPHLVSCGHEIHV